jgi:hypothetical protein
LRLAGQFSWILHDMPIFSRITQEAERHGGRPARQIRACQGKSFWACYGVINMANQPLPEKIVLTKSKRYVDESGI